MSEAVDIGRTNSGAMSSCAWPACPNSRSTFRPVEVRPGVVERLAACGLHAARSDEEALKVWRGLVSTQPPKPQHHDAALAESLAKEILRVPGIDRDRLLRWSRMQAPRRGFGPVETRAGQPTSDDRDTDTLTALAALVRAERVRERKGPNGAVAYWSNENDDDTSEEIEPCQTRATTAAANRAPATTPTSTTTPTRAAKSARATGTRIPTTPTLGVNGTTPAPTSASGEPRSQTTAAETPSEKPNEPATSKPPDVDTAASIPAAATNAAPDPTDPARPIALPSLSDDCDDDPDGLHHIGCGCDAPSDPEPKVTQATQIITYVGSHPGATTVEIAAGVGLDPKRTSGALASVRKGGHVRSERAVRDGGPVLMRWWLADAPAPTNKPKPKAIANNEQERAFESKLNHWKGRAESAEAKVAAAEHNGVAFDGDRVRGDFVDVAREVKELRAEKAIWLADESELRDWRCQVETALGFDEDEHVEIGKVTDRIAKLQARQIEEAARRGVLDAVSDVIVFEAERFTPDGPMNTFDFLRLTLRKMNDAIKASEANDYRRRLPPLEVGAVDGIPYDAALRHLARLTGASDHDLANGITPTVFAGVCKAVAVAVDVEEEQRAAK